MVVELGSQRDLFDVPAEIAYFNTASLSPVLRSVRAAGESALRRRARPWEIGEADWFADVERLRALAGQLVGGDAEGIALVPATSYGFALAAANLPLLAAANLPLLAAANLPLEARQQVLVLAEEYPSGVYTWRRAAERSGASVRTVTRETGQTWTEAVLAAIDERVAIVSVPNVHWTDGGLVDLEQVAARTHAAGARLVVDASQSLGVMPLDVAALRPDFVVAVGYKWLLSPFGNANCFVARRGDAIRVSPHLHVTEADADRLVETLVASL